jgi:putative transposase
MEPALRFFNPDAVVKTASNRLPHWDQLGATFFITFRLADSVPQEALHAYVREHRQWEETHPPRPWPPEVEDAYRRKFTRRFERWLDRGAGECLLRDQNNAEIVADAFRHFEGERSLLHAWVVMPNHVHLLVSLVGETSLAGLLHAWKGFSARKINERLGRVGSVWQKSYFDRLVRDWEHFVRCSRYIRANPSKANLQEGEFLIGESELVRRVLA